MQVYRFELSFKSRYFSLLSQKYGLGDTNHSTVTGFFKRSKTWFKELSRCKGFLFAGSYRPYMFPIRKITK